MRQIKVGDILTVKQWGEMEREYPLTNFGGIDGDGNVFTKNMKEWCGKPVTITKVRIDNRQIVHLKIKEDNGFWGWCHWMFKNECRDENDAIPHTDEEIIHFLTDAINGVLN